MNHHIFSRAIRFTVFFISFSFFFMPFSFGYALKEPFDHSLWDKFLHEFVNENGEVNYAAVKKDPSLLEQYGTHLIQDVDTVALESGEWPREEQLALLLNAYHYGIVSIVMRSYPIKSIQEIPGAWDQTVVRIGLLRHYSLNQIRNAYLIEPFRDEKIHAALSCGARSCPKFPREAFTGPKVEGQLYLAAKAFVNDKERNKIEIGKNKIYISRIFKWYGQDFRLDFGASENERKLDPTDYAILSFIAHYLEDPASVQYLEEKKYKIQYLPFDWSLNDWVPAPSQKT